MKKFIGYTLVSIFGFLLFSVNTSFAYTSCMTEYGIGATSALGGGCKCSSGHIWGTDALGEKKCVDADDYCQDKLGYNSSFDSLSNSCECDSGYFIKDDISGSECVAAEQICRDKFGLFAEYDSYSDKCSCSSGYELTKSATGYTCESCSSKYGYNSSYNYGLEQCECDDGYTLEDGECVEKEHSVYFNLEELDEDNDLAILESEYSNGRYLVEYGLGCMMIGYYIGDKIVVNLGTDYEIDTWEDYIVLQDDDETCDILDFDEVSSNYTFKEKEENSNPTYTKEQIEAILEASEKKKTKSGKDNEINNKNNLFTDTNNSNNKETEEKTTEDEVKETNTKNKNKQEIDKIAECSKGKAPSLDNSRCIPVPENAHPVDSETDVWLCNKGYKEVGYNCIRKKNSSTSSSVINNNGNKKLQSYFHDNNYQKSNEKSFLEKIWAKFINLLSN